jgi:hypothetical protein
MSVNDSHTPSVTGTGEQSSPDRLSEDRYCHHCREIALAYDPASDRARCRACGELA